MNEHNSDYLVIYEKTSTGYSAYVPDLPGCITTGKTFEEIDRNIREAIELHVEALRAHNQDVPADTLDALLIAV